MDGSEMVVLFLLPGNDGKAGNIYTCTDRVSKASV